MPFLNMYYYLDTNSLRKLAGKLHKTQNFENLSTSILSLMEIASGITDENSYNLRKPILNNILNSRITIRLSLPETLIYKSFGFQFDDRSIVEGIGKSIIGIVNSNSLNDFKAFVASSTFKEYYEFLMEYDKKAPTIFKEAYANNIDIARKKVGFKNLINAYNKRWFSNDENDALVYFNTLISEISRSMWEGKSIYFPNDTRTFEQIKATYDHSIDVFLIMTSLYSDSHVSFGSPPGINDYFDLSHILYINNLETKIVTDDKLFGKLLKRSFSKLLITTEEFVKENGI
jgi:hypothetical protein